MKLLLIPILISTNIIVGSAFYSLGFARHASKSVTSNDERVYTGMLLSRSHRESSAPPMPSPQAKVLSSPSLVAMAGPGLRGRLANLMLESEDMDSTEVLSSLKDLKHQPGSPDTLMAQQLLLARYAELDPETALSYVDSLRGLSYEMGALTVMSAWAANDPRQAARHFEANAEDFGILDDAQGVAAGSVAAEWARQDPDRALEWADTLPDGQRGEAFGRIMAEIANTDPNEAVEILAAMAPGYERSQMLDTLVDQWAHQDPEAAADWLVDNAEGEDGVAAADSLMNAWMSSSPMQASIWLADLPDGTMKDNAILALTESRFVQRDPEAQVEWSASIHDPATRDQAVERAVGQWLETDPQTAEAWLQDQVGGYPDVSP